MSTLIPPLPACLHEQVELVHHQTDRRKLVSFGSYLKGAGTRFRHWQLAQSPGCDTRPGLPVASIQFITLQGGDQS